MIDLERIKIRLRRANLEDVLESFHWREFEEVVAKIFERNNFSVKLNFRFKANRNKRMKWYEIDLIASNSRHVFCVDCKKWGGGRYKKHALKRAVAAQKERALAYGSFLRIKTASVEKQKIYPLIVTLMEEELVEVDGVFIVPVWKLNSFLTNLESYLV